MSRRKIHYFGEHMALSLTCEPICVCVQCSCMCVHVQSCLTLCDPMDCSPPGSSVFGDSPGKNTGVGCHVLLHKKYPIGSGTRRMAFINWETWGRGSGKGLLDIVKSFYCSPLQSNCLLSGPFVASHRDLAISLNLGIQILDNPAMPRK